MKVVLYGSEDLLRKTQIALGQAGIDAVVVGDLNDFTPSEPPSLFIADISAPAMSPVCDHVRKTWEIPIVLLLGSNEDGWARVNELTADGYLPRTAGSHEIVARVRAILRRGKKAAAHGGRA